MTPARRKPAARGRAFSVAVTDEMGRPARAPGLARWLEAIAPAGAKGQVVIALVPDRVMRRLNRRYAGVDRVTDVLSFPASPEARKATGALGDIIIATGRTARQAAAAGHSVGTELRVLALHGLLHLLGHDHHTDDGAMARLERRLRRRGGLGEGLIERASS